jgi:hypothetical protein
MLASQHVAWACVNARPVDGASPQPDPLGHLSSRNRGSTGWRLRCCATLPGRFHVLRPSLSARPRRCDVSKRSRRTNPALAKKRWARVAPARPALARPAVRTPRCDAPLHLRETTRLAAAPGSDEAGPLAQSRPHTGPRAASPDLPRRGSGSAEARGAFHRRAAWPGVSWAFAHDAMCGLSPATSGFHPTSA